ncbi:MAG: sensor histidine kinase [Cyclobacteriaceae bacterium]|nr:MAG: sensor histidine kinase [Cyclobacteriaceae bacterium]
MEQQALSDFTILFIFVTSGMLILAGGIVFFVLFYKKRMLEARLREQNLEVMYQQKMMEAALESQESERKRVAADLHDGIGAMLSAVRMNLGTLARTESVSAETIQPVKTMLDETIESVRKISRDLLPSTLEKFGLNVALKEMCERFQSLTDAGITYAEQGEAVPMEKSREIFVFRIVQELINNALKHANASAISVQVSWGTQLTIVVTDNGKGFSADEQPKGLGLFNMQNRARVLHGTFIIESNTSSGTKATLTVPLA